MDNQNEEEVILDEAEESEDESEESSIEALRQELEKEKQARIKAEQAIIKAKSKEKKPVVEKQEELSESKIERIVLKAQGTSNDELELLEKISTLNNVSLTDAKQDPYFKAWKEAKAQEEKSKEASLPASKGSRANTLTEEQRRERFLKSEEPSREEIRRLIHGDK